MNKPVSILIPNATSPLNVGNQLLMSRLVTMLKKAFPHSEIHLQGFDPSLQKDEVRSVSYSLYSWAVFQYSSTIIRFTRVLQVLFGCVVLLANKPNALQLLPEDLKNILLAYRNADIIVFEPGGYLTTRKGITQTLNFFMQLLPIWLAVSLGKKTIQAPVSVGPFAYVWQERFACVILKRVTTVFTREDITYNLLVSRGISAEKSVDLALLTPLKVQKRVQKTRRIGVVMRQWSSDSLQAGIEREIIASVTKYAKQINGIVVPIVQSHAAMYRDFDYDSVLRVGEALQKKGIKVAPVQIVNTPKEAGKIYGSVDMLLSMRMHAAVFALQLGVPSIVMTDETKAKGIFTMLGITQLSLPLSGLSSDKILRTIRYITNNKTQIRATVRQSMKRALIQRSILNRQLTAFADTTIPTVTVAVCAYNEEQNIVAFLKSVLQQKEIGFILAKIIVVSDGSTDATIAKIKSLRNKKITVIESKQRVGKSLHLNHLYRTLSTDYLVQSDADIIFGTPFVVRDLVVSLSKNRRAGLCGGNPTPMKASTFIETGVNSTVHAYMRLRSLVRKGNNPFSADGRLLGLTRAFARTITVPHDMIANDRYVYYVAKTTGWEYVYVASAIVYFRSPQTVVDQIRQNTRFVAAPSRLKRYFPEEVIVREEYIPWYFKMFVFLEQWIQNPVALPSIVVLNLYCKLLAFQKEKHLTALWDMAITTKKLRINRYQS